MSVDEYNLKFEQLFQLCSGDGCKDEEEDYLIFCLIVSSAKQGRKGSNVDTGYGHSMDNDPCATT